MFDNFITAKAVTESGALVDIVINPTYVVAITGVTHPEHGECILFETVRTNYLVVKSNAPVAVNEGSPVAN